MVGFVGMDIYVYLCTIMSKVSAYYHIVFCTKSRRMASFEHELKKLYAAYGLSYDERDMS